MKKLTTEDIVIKTSKEQVKKEIKDKFGKIKNFAEFIGMDLPRVSGYLGSKDLGPDRFRFRLMNIFQKSYDELVKSPKMQISEYTDEIFDNIQIYNDKDDIILIEKIITLSVEYQAFLARIKLERVRAMHYFFTKEQYLAKKHIKETIRRAKSAGEDNLKIFFNCDYAMMYFHEKNYDKAKKIFKAIDINRTDDDDFRNRALYKYYYAYGTLLSRMGKYKEARNKFECSLMYPRDDVLKGVAYNAMGLAYKREGKFDKALDYYEESLKVQTSKVKLVTVYNNIAELYRVEERYDQALSYCEKAIDIIENHNIQSSFSVYQTYIELKMVIGETDKAIDDLIEWNKRVKEEFIEKGHIIRGIETLIRVVTEEKRFKLLKKVETIIYELLNQEEYQDNKFVRELTNCLGKIQISYYKNQIR